MAEKPRNIRFIWLAGGIALGFCLGLLAFKGPGAKPITPGSTVDEPPPAVSTAPSRVESGSVVPDAPSASALDRLRQLAGAPRDWDVATCLNAKRPRQRTRVARSRSHPRRLRTTLMRAVGAKAK